MRNRTVLNYISFIIGAITLIVGIVKMIYPTPQWTLAVGNQQLVLQIHNSFVFIILVNYIGGLSLVYHAISTIKFRKAKLNMNDTVDDFSNKEIDFKLIVNLSKLQGFTGIVIVLINIFLIMEIILTIFPMFEHFGLFYVIISIYFLILLPFSVLPMLLIIKNFRFNNKLLERQKYLKNKLIREALKQKKK